MEAFNAINWHDATLLLIEIDRKSPGDRDDISILVAWPEAKPRLIRFFDCYGFIAHMNFGITAQESILEAHCVESSSELDEIRRKWRKVNIALDELKCFEIKTNSTASILKIFSLGFEFAEHEPPRQAA